MNQAGLPDSKKLMFRTSLYAHAYIFATPLYLAYRARYIASSKMALPSSALALRRLLAKFESNRIILLSPKRALSSGMSGVAAENRGKTGKIRADDGVELYYEQRGDGPRAILCIPGALGSVGTDFPPQTDHFGREGSGFTIVGFDPRGYGKSRPHTRDFSAPGFYQRDAMDGAGVMEKLGFQKFSVLGWSDGGVSGIILAARFPERVQKLVVWGSNASVTKSDIELVEKTRDTNKWSPRMREAMETLYGGDFPGMWKNWMDGFFGAYFDPDKQGDLCSREVSEVKCPTLVIHGLKDALCPLFHAEFLAERFRNCRYEVWPEGKHNLHLKYHQEFNELVTEFLTEDEESVKE